MRRHLRRAVVLSSALALVSCSEDSSVTQPPLRAYVTPTGLLTSNPPQVFTGAGDIAKCGNTGAEATAKLLDVIPGTVYNIGDNTYPDGTTSEFNNCYGPTWGRHKARTHPSTGNHEYNTSGATGYYNYFGAAAGDPTKGYYSYNLGAWHIVVLNSSISRSPGSAQDTWLKNDLAANPNLCTLAYWHHALYGSDEGSGTGGSVYSSMRPYWDRLYPAGADIVLNGHRHFYERLGPMKPDGTRDNQYGVREFIVGSGGIGGANITTNLWPTSESVNGTSRGVLKLWLYDDSYAWKFVPIAGQTFTDSGSTACHGAPGGGGTGGGVSGTTSTVSAAPTAITASTGSSSSTITVTAKDANGNPVSGATVVLSASGTGNTLTQPSSTTNSSGVATGTLGSTVAETKTVSATINGVAVTQTASVTVGAAAPAALAFTTQPSNTAAGSNISPAPVVEIRDAFGNRVTTATNSVTMAIGTNPGGSTLSGTTTVTAASGVATFSNLSLNKTGTGYTLTATSSGLTGTTSSAFNVTAGIPAKLAFLVQPTNTGGGATISPAVQVEIQDALGNRVTTATNTVAMAIGTNPGGGTLSGTTAVAAVNGVASFSTLSIDKAGTGYTLTASATGLTGATSTAFTVTASAISAALSTVSASPPSVTAGTASTITVTAKDGSGNPVSGATVVLQATGTGNSLTQPSGPTDANGVVTGTVSSTVAGTKTVSATISGVAVTQTAAVTVSAAAPAALAFTTQPSSTTAGATIAPAPVVELRDAFGNKTSATNTVAMAIGTNPGGGTLSGTLSVAAVNGVATFSTLSIDKAGSGYTLVASSTGLTGATSTAFTVTSVAISASLSTVSASPTSISASSGAVVSTITVTAKDVNGNLVSGATVVLGATGSGNTLTQPSATTNGSGVASGTVSSTVAGSKTVSATINGVAITQTAAVTVSAAAPAALAFTTQPSNALVGATISPAPVVELRDAFGNKTSATNTVTMAIGTNPGGGLLSGTLSVAAVNGVATFSSLSIDKAGTGYTLTASSTGLSGATSSPFNITSSSTPVTVTPVEVIMKTSNSTSYALASHTLTAGRLYVLAVETRVASGSPDVPTISGTTAGWTLQGTSLYFGVATNDARLSLFTAVPSATETKTITIGLGSVSQTHCSITLVEVQGQDASYAAQAPGFAKLDAGMATSLPVSVAAAPAAGNVMLATYIHYGVAEDVVPDGTFTELGQSSGGGILGDATTVEASYRVGGQQTATATWANPSYGAAILFEVRRAP